MPAPGRPRQERVQACTHSPPSSHPVGHAQSGRISDLFTSPAWQSEGALTQSGLSLLCPKGHHLEACALWRTLGAAPGTQECRQGRGGEPTGRSSGVSDGPGVPSHAGISQRVWAAGEQAFSVSAAHPVLKHVPSVSRGAGPVSNPSGPCNCRANHPHLPPPPTHLHLASPSLLSLIEGEGRTQVWVWASWVLISETVHPNLGRAWGKPLTPPALSHHSIPSEMNLAGVWPS